MNVELPDGTVIEGVPEGTTKAQLAAKLKANGYKVPDDWTAPAKPAEHPAMEVARGWGNVAAGAARGAGSIGATLMAPFDAAEDFIERKLTGKDRTQKGLSSLITGQAPQLSRNQQRRADMTGALQGMGADPESLAFGVGKLGGEIAGTAGVGPAIAGGLRATPLAAKVPNLISAIETGGMRAGTGAMSIPTRVAGGAVSGGASAGLVNPEDAGTGSMIGAAAGPAALLAGKAGQGIGNVLRGPALPPQMQAAVQAARSAGLVIPPTQAKPTLLNRALEGMAGKITTAQNASAKNAPVINAKAAASIGAQDLTDASISAVRQKANQAYDALAQTGAFNVDQPFKSALAGIQPKTLPGMKNADVADLVQSLSAPSQFDSQATIETLKQLRFDGFANKAAQDPAKKALGQAQIKIAGELENLIERNLKAANNTQLLKDFREARQTLAKAHTVEKALNKASGNIDAGVLARELKKGKPLTGELREVAEFASQFPKAAQTVERMGSLPQSSPLDWAAMGTLSMLTQNPWLMAGVLARPAARGLVLSGPVQNSLVRQSAVPNALMNPELQAAVLRALPVTGGDR